MSGSSGTYGPSSPADVLNTLLDGTNSNMLLIQTDNSVPTELILTPRHGGPTPPNPNAPSFDDDSAAGDDGSPAPVQPLRGPFGAVNNQPQAQIPPAQPGSSQTTPTGTDPNDPNAVKTPQQIFEQLQRLRQQQQPQPQ